ncbi:MAG TPA: lipoprotein insertase outer membrane protein LolB [Povalibacter sp.]|uniref:lipoprotein insertase outer membrane protein LolB n=1 Tax=Povalibacter sp. TaxID=1962978 RepID=UPI002BF14A01|nr:lipoprotein insertase outer membrane protein LolB [Povalibacter sp.]HMN46407.1 lipoprotein insertase outer membrane protein LolB [Povalibacter sp.]
MRGVLQRCAMLLVVTTALAACVSQPQRAPVQIPEDLNELARWQARGRIGVSGVAGGGSGSFEWRQDGDRADIQIRGPVGIGSVRLQVEGDEADPQVRLQTGDGVTLESQAAWDELEARLGAPVPAGHLRFWMLGLAAPGDHAWDAAAAAGQKALEQDGWRIVYQQYSSDAGAPVPVRMNANNGATRVRIVVDRWQLGQ